MEKIRVEFRNYPKLYAGKHLEIRRSGDQVRFYEVSEKPRREYCLKRDTVSWLLKHGSLPRLKVLKLALRGDLSIFNA